MANIPIYDGAPSFLPGMTPFGFYDTDVDFQVDAVKVAKFCASRLGYPLIDVELQSGSFFTAFEEAVTTYGNELYSYQIRDNQLSLNGSPTTSTLNNAHITPNFDSIVDLTSQYGSEAGVGGNVQYYKGFFEIEEGKQEYDLNQWAIDENIQGSIEIKKVYFEDAPSISKYYDPYGGAGTGGIGIMSGFGFGGMSPATNQLMMPLSFDLQAIQAVEMNTQIRRSRYTFELKNNQLRVFPSPQVSGGCYWFEYIKRDERKSGSITQTPNTVTNPSNTPYTNPTYLEINSVGRQWIFEYALAISKEMLGYVRGKYDSIPIPNATVSLNSSDLITAATTEKDNLITRLRDYFDQTSRKSLLERRAQETEFKQTELQQVPYTIYVG